MTDIRPSCWASAASCRAARPTSGRVVLMFQPAEENGAGAVAVVKDPRYPEIKPDWAFSLHNPPESSLASARLGVGPANCAPARRRIA